MDTQTLLLFPLLIETTTIYTGWTNPDKPITAIACFFFNIKSFIHSFTCYNFNTNFFWIFLKSINTLTHTVNIFLIITAFNNLNTFIFTVFDKAIFTNAWTSICYLISGTNYVWKIFNTSSNCITMITRKTCASPIYIYICVCSTW